MKVIRLLLFLIVLTISGCQSNTGKYHTNVGLAEGTTYRIIYQYEKDLHPQLEKLIAGFEHEFSIYDSTSSISVFNRGGKLTATKRMKECVAISQQIHKETSGLFDPTLRPLISAWGFGSDKTLKHPTQKQIDSLMQYVGFSKISIDGDSIKRSDVKITLDFNAIAKGYSVDLVGRMFDSLGINNYLVEIGGEITTKGVNANGNNWRIGIDRPTEGNYSPGNDLMTKIELGGHQGLATSGNYRKYINDSISGHVTHTIDPRTGYSVCHNLLSATIIAENTALADGYATACMVGGFEWSKKFITDLQIKGLLIYVNENGVLSTWENL